MGNIVYGRAQHLIKLAFISQGRIYRGNKLHKPSSKDRYILIEQSGIYSNRAVTYTLIKYVCEYPYPYVKESVKFIRHSNIKCKTA